MSERYLDLVLDGRALWTDIEDYVERWHSGRTGEPLHDYLGLTWEEYSLWVEQPQALRLIIAARERRQPLVDLVTGSEQLAWAARGLSPEDARTIREWLAETGRIPST